MPKAPDPCQRPVDDPFRVALPHRILAVCPTAGGRYNNHIELDDAPADAGRATYSAWRPPLQPQPLALPARARASRSGLKPAVRRIPSPACLPENVTEAPARILVTTTIAVATIAVIAPTHLPTLRRSRPNRPFASPSSTPSPTTRAPPSGRVFTASPSTTTRVTPHAPPPPPPPPPPTTTTTVPPTRMRLTRTARPCSSA